MTSNRHKDSSSPVGMIACLQLYGWLSESLIFAWAILCKHPRRTLVYILAVILPCFSSYPVLFCTGSGHLFSSLVPIYGCFFLFLLHDLLPASATFRAGVAAHLCEDGHAYGNIPSSLSLHFIRFESKSEVF